jgi:hypothetical protein
MREEPRATERACCGTQQLWLVSNSRRNYAMCWYLRGACMRFSCLYPCVTDLASAAQGS